MENQHLTYFKVENFKKFDSLEVKDIGQFNLIVGDNNVGKTCLLEALLLNTEKDDESKNTLNGANILMSLFNRKIINLNNFSEIPEDNFNLASHLSKKENEPVKLFLNKEEASFSFNSFQIDDLKKNVKNLTSEVFKIVITFDFFQRLVNGFNYPLISFNSDEIDIMELYNSLSTKKDKENLINVLRVIFPLILDVEYKVEFKQFKHFYILF